MSGINEDILLIIGYIYLCGIITNFCYWIGHSIFISCKEYKKDLEDFMESSREIKFEPDFRFEFSRVEKLGLGPFLIFMSIVFWPFILVFLILGMLTYFVGKFLEKRIIIKNKNMVLTHPNAEVRDYVKNILKQPSKE